MQLVDLTRLYLEGLMIAEYSQTSLTLLDDFLTFMIGNFTSPGEPIQIDYESTGLFDPSSIFLPTVRELDGLIDTAFMGENLDEYLRLVRELPSDNIFSSTIEVSKESASPSSFFSSESAGGGSGFVKVGVASAAAGIVVLAAGLVLLKKRREDELDDEYNKTIGRNLKAESTIGETFNSSLDSSSSWRRESPYETEIIETEIIEVLEDESLESDDESDYVRRPQSEAFKHAFSMFQS